MENGEQRIRGGAAVLAAVLPRLEGTDLERDIGDPAQRRGECRSPWGDAAHVTDDQRIGAEQIGIVERVAQQRAAPNLLVALDTELDRPEACLSTRAGRRGGRSRWTWYYRRRQIGPDFGMMLGCLKVTPDRCRRTLRRRFGSGV